MVGGDAGAAAVIGQVIDHAAVGARLSVVALHHAPIPTNYLMVLMKELTIRGSIEYPPAVRGCARPAGPA